MSESHEPSWCPACGSGELRPLVSLGHVPVRWWATWDDREAARSSPTGEMVLSYCPACAHVCNTAFDPSVLGVEDVVDRTDHSRAYETYGAQLAHSLAEAYDLRGKHVLDVACGGGGFLRDVCRAAECVGTGFGAPLDGGLDGRQRFVQGSFRSTGAPAFDFFVCRNALEYRSDPFQLLHEIRVACGRRVVQGYVEVPDAIYDFERSGLDCIYPHVSYFSATSLARLAMRAGFAVLRLVRNFEGQFLALELGVNTDTPAVPQFEGMGLRREREILAAFAPRFEQSVVEWRRHLEERPGRCVVWGADAKGVGFVNAADPNGRLAGVVDLSPWKRGRHLALTGHPVIAPEDIRERDVSHVVVTNPVHESEIRRTLDDLGVHAEIFRAFRGGDPDEVHAIDLEGQRRRHIPSGAARQPGRVALITGGASGIGAATAIELGRRGIAVAIADLPGSDAECVAQTVRASGVASTAHPVDVRDFDSIVAMVDAAEAELGEIDILFANAGIEEQSQVETGDPALWRAVVETNLLGVAYSIRAVLPAMKARDRGDIIVNASVSGRTISVGNPVYTASKWGVVGFTQMVRNQLALQASAVRVTLLEPGLTDTPLSRTIPGVARRLEAGHALDPEDVAHMVAYVVEQPPHVLLGEIRLEPQFRAVRPTVAARVGMRIARALGS